MGALQFDIKKYHPPHENSLCQSLQSAQASQILTTERKISDLDHQCQFFPFGCLYPFSSVESILTRLRN